MTDYTECAACGEYVDYCQGGHGAACQDCDGYATAHTRIECVAIGRDGGTEVLAYPVMTGAVLVSRDDAREYRGPAYGIGTDVYDGELFDEPVFGHDTIVCDVYVVATGDDDAEEAREYAHGVDPYPDYRITVRQDTTVWEAC